METGVVKYDITEAAISEMKSQYMELRITDLEDKEQFDVVHSARMVVKNHRVAVEKRRKVLKADALQFGREVDAKAKVIFGWLEPIETHLEAEENKVTEAEKRKKEEADRIEREKIQARVDALQKFGVVKSFVDVAMLSDDEFKAVLDQAQAYLAAEQKRIEDERIAREAETKRLIDERAELERQKAAQAAEQKRLDEIRIADEEKARKEREALEAEKRAVEQEKARITHEEAVKKAAEEARIKAEKEAQERAELEKKLAEENRIKAERDAIEKAEREAVEKARQENLRPDREKLHIWANSILDIVAPELADEKSQKLASETLSSIYKIARDLIEKANAL